MRRHVFLETRLGQEGFATEGAAEGDVATVLARVDVQEAALLVPFATRLTAARKMQFTSQPSHLTIEKCRGCTSSDTPPNALIKRPLSPNRKPWRSAFANVSD